MHVPPRWLRSTKATFQPCRANARARGEPACPEPIMTASNSMVRPPLHCVLLPNTREDGILECWLARDPQIVGESPLVVGPLPLPAKSGALRDVDQLVLRILVAGLRPDGFTAQNTEAKASFHDGHGLIHAGPQVHLYVVVLIVENRHMFKLFDVEVRIQFAIDSHQQISVKSCGNAERVVIGRCQRRHWFPE